MADKIQYFNVSYKKQRHFTPIELPNIKTLQEYCLDNLSKKDKTYIISNYSEHFSEYFKQIRKKNKMLSFVNYY